MVIGEELGELCVMNALQVMVHTNFRAPTLRTR